MKFFFATVFVLSAYFCLADDYRGESFRHFLPGELVTEVETKSQFRREGALCIVKFQAQINESGVYYVACGTVTRRGTAYCKGYYATQKIEGEAGEVIQGAIEFNSPMPDGIYRGPNGPEYVATKWVCGTYKDPKDIWAGDYWRD